MKQRTMDEMIAYFNQQVEKMDIDRQYKIALFGMITAIGYKNKEQERHWIPCSKLLPEPPSFCLVTTDGSHSDVIDIALYMSDGWHKASEVIAWMPLPESYQEGRA